MKTYTIHIDEFELAVILAALRIAQEEGMPRLNFMPQMDGMRRAVRRNIDQLCDRINADVGEDDGKDEN